jgi:selenide,water dikinase
MGPGDLKQTICQLKPENENILVGFENSEDASVFKINENEALVQTLDFITPVVDDPYIYGKIAAANSLSDIFAMGADPKTAMNIVGFDAKNFNHEVLNEILRGGNDKIKECGAVLMGGHTIETPEMYYGLSVTGMIHPSNILRNNSGRIGDVLILTKPIGLGILTTAIKRDLLNATMIKEVIKVMECLNYETSKILKEYRVSACTDITGFSLLGHSLESTRDEISYKLYNDSIPVFDKVKELIEQDVVPGGSKKNKKYLEDKVLYASTIDETRKQTLCDAQTSGGLLIAIHPDDAKEYLKRIEDFTFGYATIVGEIIKREDKAIIVI